MYYAQTNQISTARHIARSAQQQIKEQTGMRVTLMLYAKESVLKTPERMLGIIADALEMSPECYKLKTRMRNVAELRFLGALFLRQNYPSLTLHDIAALYGGQDHSSVLHGLAKAYDLIHTGDDRFLKKYKAALNSVTLWLRKEA